MHNVAITPEMLQSVQTAYSRYKHDLEQKRQESSDSSRKRKLVDEKVANMKKDNRQQESDRARLLAEADEFCERAVKSRKIDLVMKWNVLKDYTKKNQSEVQNFKQKLKELFSEASSLGNWCEEILKYLVKSEYEYISIAWYIC